MFNWIKSKYNAVLKRRNDRRTKKLFDHTVKFAAQLAEEDKERQKKQRESRVDKALMEWLKLQDENKIAERDAFLQQQPDDIREEMEGFINDDSWAREAFGRVEDA